MRGVIEARGLPALPRRQPSAFSALTRSITAQQLATSAANAIWKRTNALAHGRVTADAIVDIGAERLREAGQSRAKIVALLDLAERCQSGSLKLGGLSRKKDADVIEALCAVKGIGVWSAQMFLIFHLRRLDVWPIGDLAVRRGYSRLFGVDVPTPKALQPLGDAFAGHRSCAAWYCWRASD